MAVITPFDLSHKAPGWIIDEGIVKGQSMTNIPTTLNVLPSASRTPVYPVVSIPPVTTFEVMVAAAALDASTNLAFLPVVGVPLWEMVRKAYR